MNLEADIRAQLPRASEAIAGLSAEQINWRPAEGSWSLGECFAHLNTVNHLYAGAIHEGIIDARQHGWKARAQPKLGLLERWFVHTLEPPYKLKFKAPSKFRPPSTTFDRHGLLCEWTSTHERLAELAQEAREVDMKRVKVVSPATPLLKVSLLCALMIPSAHDRRHLWQAGLVRERLLTR